MKTAAGKSGGKTTILVRIVGYPCRLHLQDAERHPVIDHIAEGLLAWLSRPLNDRMRVVGRPQWSLRSNTRHHLSGAVDRGQKHDRIGTGAQSINVESALHTVLAIAVLRAACILGPQAWISRRLGNHQRAVDVRITPAKALRETESIDARGLHRNYGHRRPSCRGADF